MRRLSALLLALALLYILSACGGRPALAEPAVSRPSPSAGSLSEPSGTPAQNTPADDGFTVYDCGGVQIALPSKYLGALIVDTSSSGTMAGWVPLMSVYEKASYEAGKADFGEGMGFLFGYLSLDQAAFEQFLCEDLPGSSVFATDGERYFVHTFPTDVQFYRPDGEMDMDGGDWKSWQVLNEQLEPIVRKDMMERNGLEEYDMAQFLSRAFTWDGYHDYWDYRPDPSGEKYTLVLSQPVRQGEGGIWCVDRWITPYGTPLLWFPDSGKPAADYYAALQKECDAGGQPERLTPRGAVEAFIKEHFSAPEQGILSETPADEIPHIDAALRLREMDYGLQNGHAPDQMALLDCVSRITEDNWASLGLAAYAPSDWWTPITDAVADAAVGTDQPFRNRAVMSFYLTIRNGPEESRLALAAALQAQRKADPAAFEEALQVFSSGEQAVLREAAGI